MSNCSTRLRARAAFRDDQAKAEAGRAGPEIKTTARDTVTTYDAALENIPTDPTRDLNYTELLFLWKNQQQSESPLDFAAWDREVQAALSGRELEFYLDADMAREDRLNHLTKILVYRQRVKTQPGFNG